MQVTFDSLFYYIYLAKNYFNFEWLIICLSDAKKYTDNKSYYVKLPSN